jgi:hypothetical protein
MPNFEVPIVDTDLDPRLEVVGTAYRLIFFVENEQSENCLYVIDFIYISNYDAWCLKRNSENLPSQPIGKL